MNVDLLEPTTASWAGFLQDVRHDFYHQPAYVELCARQEGGQARALFVDDGDTKMLLPLIVRPIPGGGVDAISPYGYPGPVFAGRQDAPEVLSALQAGADALAADGVVSLFIRLHPLLDPAPPQGVGALVRHDDTVSIDLTLSTDALWGQIRRNHRQQIRQSIDAGHRFSVDSDPGHHQAFRRLYRATMSRVGADAYYFFDDAYFDALQDALAGQIHLGVVEIDEEVAAAGLFVVTCGIAQMHLTAHDERFLGIQPMKHVFHGITEWTRSRGDRVLHLGGGRGGTDDSLLHFKSGFSPLRHPFHTRRIVTLEREYDRLVAQHGPATDPRDLDGYFPLYRRP